MSYFYKLYKKKIIPYFIKKKKYNSIMKIPKILKIVLSMNLSKLNNKKTINNMIKNLYKISSQKPKITKVKKAISSFKIRFNQPIGCIVTLRKKKMYDFLNRLITIALPKIKDFKGISKNIFDNFGNCNLGIKEQIIFPEINYNNINYNKGMNINIIILSKNNNESIKLLKLFKFPFKK